MEAGKNARLAWSFAEDFRSRDIHEVAERAPNGIIRNGAERAVTGRNWNGAEDLFVAAPQQYGAIYFHSDDMLDSEWEYNLSFELPKDLRSGVYAVRLEAGGSVDLYPLFVRPIDEGADVLFVAPTNTYLAYANDHFAASDMSSIMGHERVVSDDEVFINAHPEFGLSSTIGTRMGARFATAAADVRSSTFAPIIRTGSRAVFGTSLSTSSFSLGSSACPIPTTSSRTRRCMSADPICFRSTGPS